ncbi:hypothetical protein Tsp_12663, partial [Trichinella spiralis]
KYFSIVLCAALAIHFYAQALIICAPLILPANVKYIAILERTRLGRIMQSEGCFSNMLINVLPCVTVLISNRAFASSVQQLNIISFLLQSTACMHERTHKEGGFQ